MKSDLSTKIIEKSSKIKDFFYRNPKFKVKDQDINRKG